MRSRWPVETTTSNPSGAAARRRGRRRSPSSVSVKIVSLRVPAAHLGAPGAGDVRVGGHPRAADPDEIQPAAVERLVVIHHKVTAAPRARATSSSAISSAASGRASASIASRIVGEPPGARAARRRGRGTRSTSASGTTTAPPPRSKWRALSVWWSAVACGYGTRIAGVPAAASSQTVPPARETARSAAASASPKWSVCEQHVARPLDPRASAAWSRSPRDVEHVRAVAAPRLDRHLVQRPRAGERAEHGDDGPRSAKPNGARPSGARDAAVRLRDRPADDAHLPAVAARDLVREEQAPRERRREPVREPEVRVGLRQRGGDAAGAARRAPSARRRSPLRRGRRRGRRRARIRRQWAGAAEARQAARSWAALGRRGRPETGNVSSGKPASGTSRDSTRSAVPANVTVTPRSRSASPTASAGRT